MGIFSWLFGKSASARRPPAGRYGKARHKVPGDWVQTTMMVRLAGGNHRISNVLAFTNAVIRTEKSGQEYGLTLRPEPSNPHDRNAIAVYGVALGEKWHIGYLDVDTAEEINRDLLGKNIPIAAELYEIWIGDNDGIDVKLIVLAPPGNGTKARLRKKAD